MSIDTTVCELCEYRSANEEKLNTDLCGVCWEKVTAHKAGYETVEWFVSKDIWGEH